MRSKKKKEPEYLQGLFLANFVLTPFLLILLLYLELKYVYNGDLIGTILACLGMGLLTGVSIYGVVMFCKNHVTTDFSGIAKIKKYFRR